MNDALKTRQAGTFSILLTSLITLAVAVAVRPRSGTLENCVFKMPRNL